MALPALPSFELLRQHYPTGPDGEAIRREIGGQVTAEWLGHNTCVIRMSRAMNYSGEQHRIPAGRNGLLTVAGADGLRYAVRVAEFIEYLKYRYGKPQIIKAGEDICPEAFGGCQGIIVWNVNGWNDARGHFTLWDGQQGLYVGRHDYFSMPKARQDPALGKAPWLEQTLLWNCCA